MYGCQPWGAWLFGAAQLRPDLAGLVIISGQTSTTTSEEAAILLMPKLYIVGDEPDDIILPMEEVYELLPMPKRYEIIEVKAHGTDIFQSDEGDTLRNLLVQFLEDIR